MENRPNAVAAAGDASAPTRCCRSGKTGAARAKPTRICRSVGTPQPNLLLVGTAGAFRMVLEMLWLELREPIVTWHPGQPLELPLSGRAATLVLHDVGELTYDDQHRVLRWLERTAGQIRVVSTSPESLWPRCESRSLQRDALLSAEHRVREYGDVVCPSELSRNKYFIPNTQALDSVVEPACRISIAIQTRI